MYKIVIFVVVNSICLQNVLASAGDSSPFYQKCVKKCKLNNCTDDGINFPNSYKQPVFERLLLWTCEDDCKYNCMWITVNAFRERKWNVPQFHGKWPFIRMLGMQEPASVVFSIFNFYVHYKNFVKYRKDIHWNTPFFFMWNLYAIVCMNGWFWSAVFHSRDTPLTEFMDYSCAFSIIYITFYVMVMRLLYKIPKLLIIIITTLLLAFFVNHVVYLRMGRFDYSYNMQLNIIIGTITALCWFGWCTWNRLRQPYVWKCAVWVSLSGLTLLLEIIDKPPFLWVFDFHSLWHLSSAPIATLFYSFIHDDSKFLRREQSSDDKKKNLNGVKVMGS